LPKPRLCKIAHSEDCEKLFSGILFWASGAGIRICRQHPRGLSQGGSDDTWAVTIEKVTSRTAAAAAIAAFQAENNIA